MRTTLQLAIFLSATLAWALERHIPGYEPTLVARGLPTMSPNCTRRSTCDSCFGDGYVVCDNAGCFNPDAAQQCCKNGNLCVAKDNGCCDDWGGPGVTGSSGTVPMPTATSTSALPESSSWSCTRFQGNEACCQGGGPDMHWCAGNFPSAVCYNNTVQICCSEGTVCEGEDCCGLVSASAVTPWASLASQTTSASSSDASATAAASTTSGDGAATSTGAANRARVTPFVKGVAGMGAIGIGLIL
ncbi:hypothetical protein BJX96DRAFT_150063 [Aspergillus floccosus]